MSSACPDINKGNLLRSYTELKSELEAFKLHCKIQVGCQHFLGNQKTLNHRWPKEQMPQNYRVMGFKYTSFYLTLIYFQETLEKSRFHHGISSYHEEMLPEEI